MTLYWNKNLALFRERFPNLYELLEPYVPTVPKIPFGENSGGEYDDPSADENLLKKLKEFFPFYDFSFARNNSVTASEGGIALHSKYNPEREAENAAAANSACDKNIFIFAGLGLGYTVAENAKLFPTKTFILLEPDAPHFFASLFFCDLRPLFKIEKLYFLVGADVEQAAALTESAGGFDNARIFSQKAHTLHAQEWFEQFFAAAENFRRKADINNATQERFGRLWLRNGIRNLEYMRRLDGAGIYFGAAALSEKEGKSLPALVLAAGPSLEEILPVMNEIQKRAVTVCVDTALRAVLKSGVEPDFIILTDPQFWAAGHLQGLQSMSSVLITDGAAYPSVFRFKCRKTVLEGSLFPLGKLIESRFGQKGALASGGSVSTSAWDFCRAMGSRAIYLAGLDLGYPGMQTHIKGSTFESAAHTRSNRLVSAESQIAGILFSAKNESALDYSGNRIITDTRMKLFAWWFEQKISQEKNCRTWTLSKKGLAINGVEFLAPKEFLLLPEIVREKQEFFSRAESRHSSYGEAEFSALVSEIYSQVNELDSLTRRGIALCNDILCGHPRSEEILCELTGIDREIISSGAKEIASLVFPTQRQLDGLFSAEKFSSDKIKNNAQKSKIIYKEIQKTLKFFDRQPTI